MLLSSSQKRKKRTKSNEKGEMFLPKLVRSEVNLLVFPFFALWDKDIYKKRKTEYKTVIKREDQKLEISWKVLANPEVGYPGSFDKKVYKAIEQIISQLRAPIQNPICIGSLYNLCKTMDIKRSGQGYEAIKRALIRLRITSIHSKGTFYSKEKKQWIEDVFGLYDRVIFRGEKLPDGEIADTNYLFLGSWYLDNINARYVKPIDWEYYKSLKFPISKRLYELLGVKFYGLNGKKNYICYKYSTLCSLLPVARQRYESLAKRRLDPAHIKLKQTGFLEKYSWRVVVPILPNQEENDWYLFYYPGERAKKEMAKTGFFELPLEEEALPEPEEHSKPLTIPKTDLVNQLVALNVSKGIAEDLVRHSSQQVIRKWVKAICYTKAEDKAAYLVKAIKKNWLLPEKYLKAEEREKKRRKEEKIRLAKEEKEKEEQKRKQEEAVRLDKIYNSFIPLKKKEIEEEAKKRLPTFWKERLKKEKEKLSKLTEVTLEGKKREVVKNWIEEGRIKRIL